MDITVNGVVATQLSPDSCLQIKSVVDTLKCSGSSHSKSGDIADSNDISSLSNEKVSDDEEFQDATQFFANDTEFEYLQNIRTSNQNSWLTRDSLGKNFDPLFNTYGRILDSSPVVESESACGIVPSSLPDVIESASPKVESSSLEKDAENGLVDNELPHIKVLIPNRESIGHLIKFDSPPEKKSPVDYFASPNTPPDPAPVLYTEEQLKKLLKLQELQFEETYLRFQRDLELERAKFLNEKNRALQLFQEVISSLYVILQNLLILSRTLYEQKKILEGNYKILQVFIQTEFDDLKSLSENFNNKSIELSGFHKHYDQAKEILKNYKINESKLLIEVETLEKKLGTLEEQYKSLQKTSEKLEEENPEDPKSTNDSLLTVLKVLLQKSNMKEEYLENQLKQAKDENCKLTNNVEELRAKSGAN